MATAPTVSAILGRDRNNFDLVRLIAASSVILSHGFSIATGVDSEEPLALASAFSLGQHAVNIFFVLSGLLVTASLARSAELVDFIVSRFLRIFPGLLVCVLLTVFVVGPVVSSLNLADYLSAPGTYIYGLATLSLSTGNAPLPGVFETLPKAGEVNIPLWTLKYEVTVYMLLAGLAMIAFMRRPAVVALMLVLLVVAQIATGGQKPVHEHTMIDHLVRFSLCFVVGTAAYLWRETLRLSVAGAVAAAVAIVATNGTMFEQAVLCVAGGYLMLSFAALPLPGLRRLAAGRDVSFGLYIYGWPVTQILLLSVPVLATAPLALGLCALALAIVPATASWFLIEKPALGLRLRVTHLSRAFLASIGQIARRYRGTLQPANGH